MKKVAIAFDGENFSEGAFRFIHKINEYQELLATGVFLPIVDYTEFYSLGSMSWPTYVTDILPEENNVIEESVANFELLCKASGIKYKVHRDTERHVFTEITDETRFADLLVLSSELFYENLGRSGQEEYLINTLHKAECPVVLVPETYEFPQSIILAYDGSPSSVYAIKQFAYLFPELTGLKTILVYANTNQNGIPNLRCIKELVSCHFSNISYYQLEADPRAYFETWFIDNNNPILVAGAYGRSILSETVRKSFINDVVKDHKFPVFIAHHK